MKVESDLFILFYSIKSIVQRLLSIFSSTFKTISKLNQKSFFLLMKNYLEIQFLNSQNFLNYSLCSFPIDESQ